MENSVKSVQTSKKGILYLILFIVVLLVGLSSVLTGFLLDKNGRDTFVPKTYYVEANGSFSAKNKYFTVSGDEYVKATPASLGLYIINPENTDEYILSVEEKFVAEKYYSYDALENKYNEVNANDYNLFISKQTSYKPAPYIYVLEIIGAAIFLLSFGYLYSFLQIKLNLKKMTIKQMSVIAMFSALSVILYYFAKFKMTGVFPSWLDIQFSDVPALFVTFMYGPFSGVLTIIVRFFCKLPGTSTVGVGELADVLIGTTLCLVSGFIYKKHRTIKGALCALAIGMALATLVAMISNWLILIPAYKEIARFPQSALTGIMDGILGGKGIVTDSNFMLYYLFVAVLPFNLFRYVLVFAITMILYKRLKSLIVHFVGDYDRDAKIETVDESEEPDVAIE